MRRKETSEKKKIQIHHHEGGLPSKLPPEILSKILLRLPIKTLSYCRFVCKSWFNAIDASFLSTYNTSLIHNHNNNIYIITKKSRRFYLVDLDLETNPTIHIPKLPPIKPIPIRIMHSNPNCHMPTPRLPTHIVLKYSCNGLLLLASGEQYRDYHVCNPITGDHIAVPPAPYPKYVSSGVWLGYDPISKACKIVRVLVRNVEIYNVVTGVWSVMEGDQLLIKFLHPNYSKSGKQLPFHHAEMISYGASPCSFLNGSLHWTCCRKTLQYTSNIACIVAFKLDTERFYQVPLPPGLTVNVLVRHHLFVVQECLALVHGGVTEHVDIWVMKEYGFESSWEKKYSITNIVTGNGISITGPYTPMKFMQNGEILLLYSNKPKQLGFYNPVTKAFRSFGSLDDVIDTDWTPWLHVGGLEFPV